MNRLVPCPGCRAPISVDAKACPHCGQPSATQASGGRKAFALIAAVAGGALTLTLAAKTFGLPIPGFSERAEAAVECRTAGLILADGMTCTLEQKTSGRRVDVCWTINITCANGTAGHANGCGAVDPQSKASVLVPYSAFGTSMNACDRPANLSVTNTKLR